MKPPFLGLLTLCLPLSAQDQVKPAEGLTALRAAFAEAQIAEPTVVIACRRGEPVVLLAGSDADGKELNQQTLLPLLGLSKVLAADAIHAVQKGKLDQGSGEKLGGRELTLRELLEGTTLLPDYFVVDGSDGNADAAVLRACGDFAASAKVQLRATAAGAAEFVLLEPLAFGGRHKDWPSMLRSTLGPRVPGLDPIGADAVPEGARARLLPGAEELAKLATARPALLRTLLSVKDLATWLHWRTQQEAELWTGSRMGRSVPVLVKAGASRWWFSTSAMGVNIQVSQYPAERAGMLWVGASRATAVHNQVLQAFETDLFADGERVPAAERVAKGGPGPSAMAPGWQAATRWRSAPDASGTSAFNLAIGFDPAAALALTSGSDQTSFSSLSPAGSGLEGVARSADGALRWLWLWPQPDRNKPVKLGLVLVTLRTTRTAAATSPGSSVPQYAELLPEPK